MARPTLLIAALVAFCFTTPALSNGIVGLWQTEPDRKDLTSHIQIAPCGPSFCGTILRAFNPEGEEVQTKNIGKRLFWDVEDLGEGRYGEGVAFVPLINARTENFILILDGENLIITGRMGPMRSTSTWTRIQ